MEIGGSILKEHMAFLLEKLLSQLDWVKHSWMRNPWIPVITMILFICFKFGDILEILSWKFHLPRLHPVWRSTPRYTSLSPIYTYIKFGIRSSLFDKNTNVDAIASLKILACFYRRWRYLVRLYTLYIPQTHTIHVRYIYRQLVAYKWVHVDAIIQKSVTGALVG